MVRASRLPLGGGSADGFAFGAPLALVVITRISASAAARAEGERGKEFPKLRHAFESGSFAQLAAFAEPILALGGADDPLVFRFERDLGR
jgi:hypothetical protein